MAAIAIGAFIGAMTSAAVHGIRGGSGSGAFLAMLGGAAGGAVGGYAGGALSAVSGAAAGGLAGSGVSMAQLISAGGKIVAGAMMPDYPQSTVSPNFDKTIEYLRKEGIKNSRDYYQALMNKNTYINQALEQVTQGTGPNGEITYGDLMQVLDPTGLKPTEGEMTLDRWKAISPVYSEATMEKYSGLRNRGQGIELNEALEGVQLENPVGPQYTKSGIPLRLDPESGTYKAYSPFDDIPIPGSAQDLVQSKMKNFLATSNPGFYSNSSGNTLESQLEGLSSVNNPKLTNESDNYYTTDSIDSVADTTKGNPKIDYSRQTARYNSYSAARASEDALRAQALLQTSKSLNLPRFDEEYNKASRRYTQKPKPFS